MKKTSPDIHRTIKSILKNYSFDKQKEHILAHPMPIHREIISNLLQLIEILFPGYFTQKQLTPENFDHYFSNTLIDIYENISSQVAHCLVHECYKNRKKVECDFCGSKGKHVAYSFMQRIPHIRKLLALDIEAAYEGDPAAKSLDEIVYSYPGLYAIATYRIAHELHILGVPLIPRIMTEYAHHRTGIDIHPGATIGKYFFIDHGTGVVVGETTIIGNHVKIYQGVTLGALSFPKDASGKVIRNQKRHPTIEDKVTIYSGATILGGKAVIGKEAIIGGNVWITESIPAKTTVLMERPKLVLKKSK